MGSVMCGRRGAVGSATAEDVLAGKTFSSDKGVNIAGTMPYRGQCQYTKTMGAGNGYYALNGIPEGCYRAEGQSWAPEIRISAEDAKNSQMWKDAYNNGFANGYANGYAAATKKLRYPSSVTFWRYSDGASVVYPTVSKGPDGVWVLDIPKDHINSAGSGTPTGYEVRWTEATLS